MDGINLAEFWRMTSDLYLLEVGQHCQSGREGSSYPESRHVMNILTIVLSFFRIRGHNP